MTALDILASVIGSVAGALIAIGSQLRPTLGRFAALLTLAVAVCIISGLIPGVVALVVVPGCCVMGSMAWRWSRLPVAAHRAFGQFDRQTRSTVVVAESAGAWPWVLGSAVAGIGVAWLMASDADAPWFGTWGNVASAWVGVMALAGLAVSVAAARSKTFEALAEVHEVPPGRVTVVPADSGNARWTAGVIADRIRSAGMTVAVVAHPPFLFRGLAGWNLGLGLDSEHAAWAGQLARSVGLGPVLAEPAPLVSGEDAAKLLICRALATGDEMVLLDEPVAGIAASELRDMARLVARALGDRRLIITTADPTGHQSFVARVLSRS